jgi:Pyruvate/2-oxoacid:ferredoxin oxidoreductase delta subunit
VSGPISGAANGALSGALTCAVVTSGCLGCGACLLTCPERAIRPAGSGATVPLTVRASRCTGCGECVEVCPADAIYLAMEVMA